MERELGTVSDVRPDDLAGQVIRHLLSKVPYEDMTPKAVKLPPRRTEGTYKRPPLNEQFFVPNNYT